MRHRLGVSGDLQGDFSTLLLFRAREGRLVWLRTRPLRCLGCSIDTPHILLELGFIAFVAQDEELVWDGL